MVGEINSTLLTLPADKRHTNSAGRLSFVSRTQFGRPEIEVAPGAPKECEPEERLKLVGGRRARKPWRLEQVGNGEQTTHETSRRERRPKTIKFVQISQGLFQTEWLVCNMISKRK
jgi:hypothetical protein